MKLSDKERADKERIIECDYGFLKELIRLYFKNEHETNPVVTLNNIKIKRRIEEILNEK